MPQLYKFTYTRRFDPAYSTTPGLRRRYRRSSRIRAASRLFHSSDPREGSNFGRLSSPSAAASDLSAIVVGYGPVSRLSSRITIPYLGRRVIKGCASIRCPGATRSRHF